MDNDIKKMPAPKQENGHNRPPRRHRPHRRPQGGHKPHRKEDVMPPEEMLVTPEVVAPFDEDIDEPSADSLLQEQVPAAVQETAPTVEIVGVHFRTNPKVYYFDPKGVLYAAGSHVIVETNRGKELGTIALSNRPVSVNGLTAPLREVLRKATEDDMARYQRNAAMEKEAAVICAERIKKYGLDMKIVDVEYTFDNSKLLFYFTSEARVDFRELVKNLASIFKTRIELRQIGIRDEAKMMGGLGSCGRPFCCSTFLSDFAQVSIKMAKEQNFSLNSAKISGSCGRLMCCLRYEHEAYEEAIKLTPSVGSTVITPNGEGVVIETRPLAGMVKVRFEDKNDAPKYFSREEVTVTGRAKRGGDKEKQQESGEKSAPAGKQSHAKAEKNGQNQEKRRIK